MGAPLDVPVLEGIAEGLAARSHVLKAPTGLKLQLALKRLTELRLLEEHGHRAGGPRFYAIHPAVSDYFYRALREDVFLHEAASDYLSRQLGPDEFRTRVRGAVRTRGGTRLGVPPRAQLPAGDDLLDLAEQVIYHTLKAGRPQQAGRFYLERLGGYEHLGETLRQHSRGLRILAQILEQIAKTPDRQNLWLKQKLETDYDQFRKAAAPRVT
jgi:hypothetical protein